MSALRPGPSPRNGVAGREEGAPARAPAPTHPEAQRVALVVDEPGLGVLGQLQADRLAVLLDAAPRPRAPVSAPAPRPAPCAPGGEPEQPLEHAEQRVRPRGGARGARAGGPGRGAARLGPGGGDAREAVGGGGGGPRADVHSHGGPHHGGPSRLGERVCSRVYTGCGWSPRRQRVWVERWPKARFGSGGSRAPGPLVLAPCPVRSPPLPRSSIIPPAKGLPDEELHRNCPEGDWRSHRRQACPTP